LPVFVYAVVAVARREGGAREAPYAALGKRLAQRWECQRDCDAGGRKTYDSPAAARRFAAAVDREDRDELGRRAPMPGDVPVAVRGRRRYGCLHRAKFVQRAGP
jgi:hypothetical protein